MGVGGGSPIEMGGSEGWGGVGWGQKGTVGLSPL